MSMAKFQKMKHFHFYLWILAHGLSETTPTRSEVTTNEPSTSRIVNNSQPNDQDGSESSHSHTVTTSTPHILPSASFPWVATVTQLALGGRGPGWLCYNDIIPNMPLSLCGILMSNLVGGGVRV